MNSSFIVGAFIIGLGTAFFFEIVQRVTPLNQYKLPHPIRIIGVASFVLVVASHFLGFSLARHVAVLLAIFFTNGSDA